MWRLCASYLRYLRLWFVLYRDSLIINLSALLELENAIKVDLTRKKGSIRHQGCFYSIVYTCTLDPMVFDYLEVSMISPPHFSNPRPLTRWGDHYSGVPSPVLTVVNDRGDDVMAFLCRFMISCRVELDNRIPRLTFLVRFNVWMELFPVLVYENVCDLVGCRHLSYEHSVREWHGDCVFSLL